MINKFYAVKVDSTILHCAYRVRIQQHHRIVELLVLRAHRKVKHSGASDTLTYLRESYWILKGWQVVRKIIKSCVVCRRLEGPPYPAVPASDLPFERVSEHPPFTHTGVDFAGPLYLAEKDNTGKAYICLFTYASTRAVHLELTHDMGVDSFLLASTHPRSPIKPKSSTKTNGGGSKSKKAALHEKVYPITEVFNPLFLEEQRKKVYQGPILQLYWCVTSLLGKQEYHQMWEGSGVREFKESILGLVPI